jgi:protein-glucosylgalactosylhydroxylysine glucosidase
VRSGLVALPVKDGVYLAHENCPQTFTERNRDHPSMLGALGVLPGTKVDRETMRRTLKKVFTEWKWADTWGWDFPMVAMTAASLGETGLAIDALMMDTPKNTWLANGHNWQRANLPLYLPGNGGLLLAIAHMAHLSAFPAAWRVRSEGLLASPLY